MYIRINCTLNITLYFIKRRKEESFDMKFKKKEKLYDIFDGGTSKIQFYKPIFFNIYL